jgi:hypothetical protein
LEVRVLEFCDTLIKMAASINPLGAPPDMSLINELYEAIEHSPPAIEARKLLVQTLMSAGWLDAARDGVRELLRLDPTDSDIQSWNLMLSKESQDPTPPARAAVQESSPPKIPEEVAFTQQELPHEYGKISTRTKLLFRDMRLLRGLLKTKEIPAKPEKSTAGTELMADGRVSTVFRGSPPGSARAVARAMEREPDKAVDLAVTDLMDVARWLRSSPSQTSPLDNDAIREALVKRVRLLTASLPKERQSHASSALMHVEHELLQRTYVNDETMLGDPVADIPRGQFWVSEDGYAWDMEELAQALTSNGGILRNPLSRMLFTPSDVRSILQHPLGKGLSALQAEQGKLSQGVRLETIEQLEKVSAVLLEDMSNDQMPSRHVVDEFLVYTAMLPEGEQKAIDKLRVPAKDSHTGQPFDTTIGEAVRDAQGNRVCFHKTGDFLRQAAAHLRQNVRNKKREASQGLSSCNPQ